MTGVVIADAVVAVVAEMLVVKAKATGCWAGIYTAGRKPLNWSYQKNSKGPG